VAATNQTHLEPPAASDRHAVAALLAAGVRRLLASRGAAEFSAGRSFENPPPPAPFFACFPARVIFRLPARLG
jgi:hypothetical protein